MGTLFVFLFGRINWTTPPWIRFLKRKTQTHPKTVLAAVIFIIIFFFLSAYAYCWYKNQPQPQLIEAFVQPPGITTIKEDQLVPDDLIINFGFPIKNNPKDSEDEAASDENFNPKSVAPIQLVGKKIESGIEMSPAIEGEWFWENDSRLFFRPTGDWPAGQTFNIHFDKAVFTTNSPIKTYDYSFSTLPFNGKIVEFKFYQDPNNPKIKQAVGTIQFDFPVDLKSLLSKTSLLPESLKKETKPDNNPIQFDINLDKTKRIAYLRSQPINLSDNPRYLVLTIDKGVKPANGPGVLNDKLAKNLLIPDVENYFKIMDVKSAIVRNNQNRPEQILAIETSLGVNENQLKKHVHVYLLPKDLPSSGTEKEKKNYEWKNPGEITTKILKNLIPLNLQLIPPDRAYSTLHSFRLNIPTTGFLYIKIDKGLSGFGDFTLALDHASVLKVPEYPKEISYLHNGALLALHSEKKLSVVVRGLEAVKFDFARILPGNVNQLVTQTQGDFNNPYFINQNFNQQNISQIFSEIRHFNNVSPSQPNYTAIDFTNYLSQVTNSSGPNGLFLLKATGINPNDNTPLDVTASRLILITDLGLVVKDNKDESHDVFVQSITKGIPMPNVSVSVLGKNGLPLLTYTTDASGRVTFPSLMDFIEDKEPVAYLATFERDVSFIPFNNPNRQLNYSRFEVGGVYSNNQQLGNLSAYIFSDRGIYRPGDTIHAGMIVKQAFAKPFNTSDLSFEMTITDPRGNTFKNQKINFDMMGIASVDIPTSSDSLTGQYQVNLSIVKDDHPDNLLGSTSFQVAEFLPDRMRISSNFNKTSEGWVSPDQLIATVRLANLYGLPAERRKVDAKLILSPERLQFKAYPDMIFMDPLLDSKKPAKVFTESLTPTETNDQGEAIFNLNLVHFAKSTFNLTFFAQGFEAQNGRSVSTQSSLLVSPLTYLVGYKSDGDLNYIKLNAPRSVHLIAINPKLKPIKASQLNLQLISLQPVLTLIKKPDGTFQYQSIVQEKILQTQPIVIEEKGLDFQLPTQAIGDFELRLIDEDQTILNHLKYSVVGEGNNLMPKNAELNVKLNKQNYEPGEEIELEISSAYSGSGLITIERDKIYAVQWFTSPSNSSIQHIRLPEDFLGNGYINITFVRDWNSPDIFMNPLSYSVVPFSVSHKNQEIAIQLDIPEIAKPGELLPINFSTDKPAKIIIFAVDEGILQVANYKAPDPLGFFFQKRALEVLTQQTVDQILPQYIQDRELSAVGGDEGENLLAKNLNPFKRKTDLPVVFWSGIIDSDTTPRQLSYMVPDYFNGSLKVMAVAVNGDSIGSAEKQSELRADLIINPNTPTFVAPGDVFEVTASIANNIKNSGPNAKINVKLKLSPNLTLLESVQKEQTISEGHEGTVHFKVKAKADLGSADILFNASSLGKTNGIKSTLSIRPPTPFMTSIQSGEGKNTTNISINRTLYPQYHVVQATASFNPLLLMLGLQHYLDNFPYGCTEQLTSKAFPLLAITNQPWFHEKKEDIDKRIQTIIDLIRQRQMSNGAISYWPSSGSNYSNDFATVYAMHFLTQAKEKGFLIPDDVFDLGFSYLKNLASQNPSTMANGRIEAYAIYVLTLNEIITTNYLTNLQLELDKNFSEIWRKDITGSYLAATYHMLKSYKEAKSLIQSYQMQPKIIDSNDFYDTNSNNAQYLYLVGRHFPNQLPKVSDDLLPVLIKTANNNELNTLLSSFLSLALSTYGENNPQDASNLLVTINKILPDGSKVKLSSSESSFAEASIDSTAKAVQFDSSNDKPYFYQLIQTGFDKDPIVDSISQGMTINRDYRDLKGNILKEFKLGEEFEVHIQVRSTDDNYYTNVAIVDLLPGGFEVQRDSIKNLPIDYADIREDRVVFFTNVNQTSKEIIYRIKPTSIGTFILPSLFAQSLYNPNAKAVTSQGLLTVVGGS